MHELYAARNFVALNSLASEIGDLLPSLRDEALLLESVVHVGAALQSGDTDTALASLATLQRLRATVSPSAQPSQMPAIIEAGAKLAQIISGTSARSARARRQALTGTIDAAKSYAGLTGMDPAVATEVLTQRLKKTRDEIARADRHAKERAARADEAAGTESATQTPEASAAPVAITPAAHKSSETGPIDPYAN